MLFALDFALMPFSYGLHSTIDCDFNLGKATNLGEISKFKPVISKVKLVTVVEGDQKAPFSIATTPKCKGGRYSFPWIAPLYPRYAPYIVEC